MSVVFGHFYCKSVSLKMRLTKKIAKRYGKFPYLISKFILKSQIDQWIWKECDLQIIKNQQLLMQKRTSLFMEH